MTVSWNFLEAGDLIAAVLSVYGSRFDPVPSLFYAIVIFVGLTIVYIKTENFGTVGVVGLLTSAFTIAVLPVEVHMFAAALLAASIAITVFKILVR